MILIPFQDLSRGTWVDENALQPAQVCRLHQTGLEGDIFWYLLGYHLLVLG